MTTEADLPAEPASYGFGPFTLDVRRRVLLRGSRPVQLHSKPFDVLLTLVRDSGRTLTRQELMETLWPDSFVEEGNLTHYVSLLRKALGESREAPKYIATVPGQGYRFVAPVAACPAVEAAAVVGPSRVRRREWALALGALATVVAAVLLFALRGEVTNTRAGADSSVNGRNTDVPEAYEAYLKGRYFWNQRTGNGLRNAVAHFEQAIARDDRYPNAYAGLADAYALLGSMPTEALPRRTAMERAKAAGRRAIELDDSLASAHASLGFVSMHLDWDWPEADRRFTRAIELDPEYPTARHWYAFYLTAVGHQHAALRQIRRARELDPLSLIISTDVAELLYYARRHEEAIEQARETLELDPDFLLAHRVLALALEQQGQYGAAIRQLEHATTLTGGDTHLLPWLGYVYGRAGRRDAAQRVLDRLLAAREQRYGLAPDVAVVLAGLNRLDEAFEWLERAYDSRNGFLILLPVAPFLDPLRDDPRFADLMARVGLTPTGARRIGRMTRVSFSSRTASYRPGEIPCEWPLSVTTSAIFPSHTARSISSRKGCINGTEQSSHHFRNQRFSTGYLGPQSTSSSSYRRSARRRNDGSLTIVAEVYSRTLQGRSNHEQDQRGSSDRSDGRGPERPVQYLWRDPHSEEVKLGSEPES